MRTNLKDKNHKVTMAQHKCPECEMTFKKMAEMSKHRMSEHKMSQHK